MTINEFIFKVKRKLKYIVGYTLFQYPRLLKYNILSTCKNIQGTPKVNQATQFLGEGTIVFAENVKLGYSPSPHFYSGYGYIDARRKDSTINFNSNVSLNNNFVIISEGEGIEIGENTLIGLNVEITDSDFHALHPERRRGGHA